MRFALALGLMLALPVFAQDEEQEPEPDPGDSSLTALARRAGRDIKWRDDLEKALQEAAESKRLVLYYVNDRAQSERFGNAFKDRYMMAGPFVDTDLAWTIGRKFIPLRCRLERPLLEFLKVVGRNGKPRQMFLSDVVVPGVLFLDPDGNVVGKFDKIASASAELMFYACHQVLQKNTSFAGPSAALEAARAEHKANADDLRAHFRVGLELTKDGDFIAARDVFEEVIKRDPKSREAVESAYRLAGLARRMRDPAGARAAVKRARELNEHVGAKLDGDLLLEEALLLVKEAKFADALKALEDVIARFPRSNRAPEALFYEGAIRYQMDEESKAKEIWKGVAAKYGGSPFAWKSAAEALERGPFTNGWETIEWLPADILTGVPGSTERPRKPEEYDAVVRGGLDYLLRHQKPDGRWINVKGQFDFKEALTAIAAIALFETRDVAGEAGRAAREKALAYFEKWMERRVQGRGMNMWPWIMGAHLYARLVMDAEGDAKKPYQQKLAVCVDMLKQCQNKDGCWTYAGADPSTFSTGGALVALWEARQAGAEFEDSIVERAFKGMARLKTEKGTYQYSSIRETDEFDPTDPRGAAGRGAPCYLAEFLWKKCDLATLGKAMDDFVQYREHLQDVRKATDWHAGKWANAPYFFFYDYFYAALATRQFETKERAKYATPLRNDMLAIVEVDGSWLDWHIAGKGYGTAMALMVLNYCGAPEPVK